MGFVGCGEVVLLLYGVQRSDVKSWMKNKGREEQRMEVEYVLGPRHTSRFQFNCSRDHTVHIRAWPTCRTDNTLAWAYKPRKQSSAHHGARVRLHATRRDTAVVAGPIWNRRVRVDCVDAAVADSPFRNGSPAVVEPLLAQKRLKVKFR